MAFLRAFIFVLGVSHAIRQKRQVRRNNRCFGPACDFLEETEFDFVVVGTGAGGGTVASRLAEAGHSVLVLEAGIDKGGEYEYQMPIKHAASTETPGLAWNYYVDHYKDSRSAKLDSKMTPEGILYPRGGTLGGSTAVNAMITVLPQQSDWDRMAILTKDDSWMAAAMNKFEVDVLDTWLPTGVPPLVDLLGDLLNPGVGVGTLLRLLLIFDSTFDEMGMTNETLDGETEEEIKSVLAKIAGHVKDGVEEDNIFGKLQKYARFLLRNVNDKLREGNVEGAYAFPQMIRDGKRAGSRERLMQALDTGKLTVLTGALASKVIFSNAKAGGGCDGPCRAKEVVYLDGQGLYGAEMNPSSMPTPADSRVRVKEDGEIILSAGAFNTPQLLKQSGVGPKAELQNFDIPVHVDLVGVGENLQDRYEVGIETQMFYKDTGEPVPFVDPADCNFAAVEGDLCFKHWTDNGKGLYSTNGGVISMLKRSGMRDVSDLHIFGLPGPFRGYAPGYSAEIPKTTTRNRFTWAVLQGQTDNRGGTVKLRCTEKTPSNKCKANPRATPAINFHYYNEGVEYDEMDTTMKDSKGERDLEAMVRAIELVRRVQNRTAAKLEGTSYFMKETWPGDAFAADERFGSESKKLREFAKREAWGHHASCTAPMGCIPESEAASHNAGAGICKAGELNKNTVLDSRFRVRGTQGLRVVDASAFPRIPGTFLLLPTFIMSEKGAATIIEERAGRWPICPGAFAKSTSPTDGDNCECRDGLSCYEEGNSRCTYSWTKFTGLKSSRRFLPECHGCRCSSE